MRLPSAGDDEPQGPNLTPMIDVILVIALFFMGAARFSDREQAIDLDLPAATEAAAAPATALVIEVMAAGMIQLEGRPIEAGTLGAELLAARAAGATTVTIRGATDASHGRMTQVYEACRTAGIPQVAIAVRPH